MSAVMYAPLTCSVIDACRRAARALSPTISPLDDVRFEVAQINAGPNRYEATLEDDTLLVFDWSVAGGEEPVLCVERDRHFESDKALARRMLDGLGDLMGEVA